MNKPFYISLLAIAFFLGACTSGKSQLSTDTQKGKYKEDISSYRIRYDREDSIPKQTTVSAQPAQAAGADNKTVNARIDTISAKNKNIKMAQGYRVQVYSGGSSEEARNIRDRIYKVIPDADIYTQYKQPTFRVKVGDCYDRLEANVIYNKLRKEFPDARIIPDQINIKKD